MPPLYITRQGAKVRIDNRCLVVEKDQESLLKVPIGHVSQVVIFGNIGLTTPAISYLLNKEVDVAFLSQNGRYRGRLSGRLTPHVPLRRAQYRILDDRDAVLQAAKAFVLAKLQHQRTLLQRQQRENPHPEISAAVEQIKRAIISVPRKESLSSLRGVEGAATAAYFRGYRRLFGPQWQFESRQRRPPPDPVNVLLSFGYTLLAEAAFGALQTVGLDPYCGFLHEIVYNRPALALDLMEEFRPLIDGLALWCCHGAVLAPQDFKAMPGAARPVLLLEEGKKKYIKAYNQRMEKSFLHPVRQEQLTMLQCMQEQARQVARSVERGSFDYQMMGFR